MIPPESAIYLPINGAFGMDFTTHPETIWLVGERLIHFGVTSFLPTIVSSPPETIRHAQAVLQMGSPAGYRGARVWINGHQINSPAQ
jgi:N-acetylglucosamine-6-phosphate deacetylase